MAAIAAGAVTNSLIPLLIKTPMYDSAFTGKAWVNELLNAHPTRFYDMMGLSKHVFYKLRHDLQVYAGFTPSRHVSMDEQLAIFLRTFRSGAGHRDMQERFQRSPDTISR
jgi:hypothetical protein